MPNETEEPREDVALRLVFQKFELRLQAKTDIGRAFIILGIGPTHRAAVSALDDAEADLKLAISDYHAALFDAVQRERDRDPVRV